MSYEATELLVVRWGEARGIIQNSDAKTMVAAIEDVDLKQCFQSAYEQIKDRKGYLNKEGVFVKDE